MKFRSELDYTVAILIIVSIIAMFLPTPALLTSPSPGEIIIFLFILLITTFLIWMVFGTYYRITGEYVRYYTGPVKGKISINAIQKIIVGKTLWVGFRPATARKGLIIKYSKYDEIYFSPKNKDKFIEELLRINPSIQIEDTRK